MNGQKGTLAYLARVGFFLALLSWLSLELLTLCFPKKDWNVRGLPFEPRTFLTGDQVPNFTLQRAEDTDKTTDFFEIPGSLKLLSFWASWCHSCVSELQEFKTLKQVLKDVTIVAVNLDLSPERSLPKLMKELELTFPIYTDPDGKLAEAFDVSGLPKTFVIHETGRIVWIQDGDAPWSSPEWQEKLKIWLDPSSENPSKRFRP